MPAPPPPWNAPSARRTRAAARASLLSLSSDDEGKRSLPPAMKPFIVERTIIG